MNIDTLINLLQEKEKKEIELYYECVGNSDDDYDEECRIDFNQYRCKGCDHYYTCFDNETAAEVDAMNLHRAMQGEPLEKIFGGTYIKSEEIITDNDVPF